MHILSVIIFLPLLGAIGLIFTPKESRIAPRILAALASGSALIASLWLWAHFNSGLSDFQFIEKAIWIPALHIQYFLAVDGLSLPMIVLTTILSFLSILNSFHINERTREYFFFFLLLETALLGTFLALDMFLFYVFWELSLIPLFFLIGIWGGLRKEYAAIKFLLFTLFGSIFMLLTILAMYFHATPHTFDFVSLMAQNGTLPYQLQMWFALGLFAAFAVKVPIVPLHTWLPLAHVEAPSAVSAILAGVMLKMGAYGILRFCYGLFPSVVVDMRYPLAILGVINILYGAFCSLAQKDVKRMVAYSSVNHMGYVLLGIASLSVVGLNGAVLQMVSHGVITAALFLLIGVLYDRTHTRQIDDFGGLGSLMPLLTGFMTIACLASLGLPFFSGFISELLCFVGAFSAPPLRVLTGISLIGILLTAVFFLIMLRKVFMGALNTKWENLSDMTARELAATSPLLLLTLALGIWPGLLLFPIGTTMTHVIELLRLP